MPNVMNWYLIYATVLASSFGLSLVLTGVVRRLAIRWRILDHPSGRKSQKAPVPLLGGVAIVVTFYAVILGSLLLLQPVRGFGSEWLRVHIFDFLGQGHRVRLTGIFAGGFLIFLLGVVDDLKALSPWLKLVGQLVAALVLVWSDMSLKVFSDTWASGWLASILSTGMTIVWVILITNSLNLLDNMDGLSAGVSAIAGLSFFVCALHTEEAFVCVLLMVFVGAVAGFLFHNLNPARIYMGDAGALFCGYILATVTILVTFYNTSTPSRIAVAAPLLALSVPLFDTLSVIYLRWRSGQPIMKASPCHFSHRLVDLGMTPKQAVEFIYLVAAVAGFGAALLRKVDRMGTLIILGQTLGVFLLIVLLMNTANGARKGKSSDGAKEEQE